MKILLKFKTKSGEQKIYLVSGDSWTNATVRKNLPSFMSYLKEVEVSKTSFWLGTTRG